jgi:aryl-alcohol dehydrogenase-like predicted oxidoreductase
MQYRRLGKSELEVSVIGLGGTTFGKHEAFGHYSDQAGSVDVIHYARDLGVNLIDTADMYGDGVSESYIGKAIAGRRDQFIIASKVGVPWSHCSGEGLLSREYIMKSIEGSLQRLGTEYLDLYYAHAPDPITPIEETLGAFDDLVRQGKVRTLGCSNFTGPQISEAHTAAQRGGFSPFQVSQCPYNLLTRTIEDDILPRCLRNEMSIVAYAPLAQGVLTGKYRPGATIPENTRAWKNPSLNLNRYLADANLEIVERLATWAKDAGHHVLELAIAWLAAKPFVGSILTGVTSADQLEANVKAIAWPLTPQQVGEVEKIVGDLKME